MAMMSCKELVEWVTEYLEQTMPPADRARFDAHLDVCPGCREYLAQFRETIRLTGCLSSENIEAAMPPATREALLKAFHDLARD
jgi:predicted anti-sigma-YlaC factor YlaD